MWLLAGVWMSLAAISAFVAIRVKMPAALVEIVIGMLAGNLILLRTNAWIDFVAGFGSILLTFLAGAEIDPVVLRKQLVPSTAIGAVSFAAPFIAALPVDRRSALQRAAEAAVADAGGGPLMVRMLVVMARSA